MKKGIVFLSFYFFAVSSFLYPQNSNVDNITKFCKIIDSRINEEEGLNNYYMVHTIVYESNVRAIGPQKTTIKFYYTQPYDSLVEKDETTEILDVYKPPVKVLVEYNIAASQNVKIKYYSNENGELICCHYITLGGYTNGENYFYFENGKPKKIKFVCMDSQLKVLEQYKNYEKDSDFTKEELKDCMQVVKKWSDYKKMFDQLIYIEKLDK